MFSLFKKKYKIETVKEIEVKEEVSVRKNSVDFFDDENSIKDIDTFLNKFFECKKIYTYIIVKPPKNEKNYMQLVDNKLLGCVYTDRDKALKYLEDELSELKKQGIHIKEMKMDDIMEYIGNLKNNKVDGIAINYPYNWVTFNLKD